MLRCHFAFAAAFVLGAIFASMSNDELHAGHGDACPGCGCKVCVPSTEVKKEKKHCWTVECKDICIPKAKWPWETCCQPQCAKVKTVKVLKRIEYECEKCGYKWDVLATGCGCGSCASCTK